MNVRNSSFFAATAFTFLQLNPLAIAQSTVSTPTVGFVTITMAANSDTIIAPQLLRPSELSASVSSVSVNGSQATLSISGTSMTQDQFTYNSLTQPKVYYVLVAAGGLTGTYFTVVSNTTSTITINLDGLNPSNQDITSIEIRPTWTLRSLFPPSDANTSFTPSSSSSPGNRRTQLLIPNNTTSGVNRSASATYFFNNTTGVQDWVSTASTSTKAGDTAILPGSYIIHRNTGGTPVSLSLTLTGGVYSLPLANYLATSSTTPTDTYLALARPTDYTLSELGLDNSSFTQSTSTSPGGRRDTLLVVNMNGTGANRAAAATYFRFNNNWYSTAASTVITNTAVIPAGSAVIIRKVISDGNDRVWTNNLNVSL
jgi:uncharacterized protein (TIGR02597 family)